MGIPRPEAHYAIADYTRRGHERSQRDFRRIAELMGGTNLRFSKDGDFANNQHICGTLSMGSDPKTSVCDQWGRAHDHENLFLASTGVLPTSSTCNSTENGLAVALRSGRAYAGAASCFDRGRRWRGEDMNRSMPSLSIRITVSLVLSTGLSAVTGAAVAGDADMIAQGKYIATASDCVACHTTAGGETMAGGLAIETPIGSIMSTNITPSKENGIGKYTLLQFDAALRGGVRADGKHLYPAMP